MVGSIQEITTIADALSSPIRVKILKMLCEREWYVYELAKTLNISRQLLYLHLKKQGWLRVSSVWSQTTHGLKNTIKQSLLGSSSIMKL